MLIDLQCYHFPSMHFHCYFHICLNYKKLRPKSLTVSRPINPFEDSHQLGFWTHLLGIKWNPPYQKFHKLKDLKPECHVSRTELTHAMSPTFPKFSNPYHKPPQSEIITPDIIITSAKR
jgi:hypothetical protein